MIRHKTDGARIDDSVACSSNSPRAIDVVGPPCAPNSFPNSEVVKASRVDGYRTARPTRFGSLRIAAFASASTGRSVAASSHNYRSFQTSGVLLRRLHARRKRQQGRGAVSHCSEHQSLTCGRSRPSVPVPLCPLAFWRRSQMSARQSCLTLFIQRNAIVWIPINKVLEAGQH